MPQEGFKVTKEMRKVVDSAIKVALGYERLTGRKLGITGEIAEVLACDKLELRFLEDPIAAGYDAVDERGKKYQIKSKRVLRNEGRMGRFSQHRFHYAILVLFDKDYNVTGIWKASYAKIKPVIERHQRRNPSIREFRNAGKLVWSA